MKTILFPGWASFESFYQKELKEDFFYIKDKFNFDKNEEVNVIAWSMGTLNALKFIENHKVNKLFLMAPTMDFTKTTNEIIINKMINGIKANKEITLKNFYKMNFNSVKLFKDFYYEYKTEIDSLSEQELIKGLEFLRDEKISEINLENVKKTYIVYDLEDKIIPIDTDFLNLENKISYSRGHNFIYKNEELKEKVRSLLND